MQPIYEAHRGVCTEAPENTIAAFKLAAEQGYGMVELDPRFTKDDVCVIVHDWMIDRLARLADGSPYPVENTHINTLTFEEARALDFGLHFSEAYKGEKIPTLDEVLDFSLEYKMPLKFDNCIAGQSEERLEIFLSTIEKRNMGELVGVTSASVEFAKRIHERLPKAHVHFDGKLTEENFEALAAFLPKEQLTVWVHHQAPEYTAELVERVHEFATLGIWILHKPEHLAPALAIATPDYIETDGTLKP